MKAVFPPWTNKLRILIGIAVVGGLAYVSTVIYFGFSPEATDVGYRPEQPVLYSHALHAGELGIDCRYCHTTVERAKQAAIPPTQTCMGCHDKVRDESRLLQPVRDSWTSGMPIKWVKVHDLPDYAYFDHSAHIQAGVGCVSCHGRVDKMEVVTQEKTLSMGWCIDCHRNPEPHIRGKKYVTVMDDASLPDVQAAERQTNLDGATAHGVKPSTDCSTCHR